MEWFMGDSGWTGWQVLLFAFAVAMTSQLVGEVFRNGRD